MESMRRAASEFAYRFILSATGAELHLALERAVDSSGAGAVWVRSPQLITDNQENRDLAALPGPDSHAEFPHLVQLGRHSPAAP